MRITQAKRLHNEDEVEARVEPGKWAHGRVIGEPRLVMLFHRPCLLINVMLDDGAYLPGIPHTDVR